MPLACFAARGGGGAGASSSSSPAPAASATSVYWTHLGTVTLTWSRGQLGLVLAAELHLAGEGAAPALRFLLRPLLPWRRRGCKRFAGGGHAVAFTWDMSRARLAGRRPEPVARYSLHVCVDGELVLAAGDLALLAPSAGFLLTRRENAVAAGGGEAYATTVAVAGGRHEVSIAVEDAVMWVAIDGEKALQVRRLRWKFRGSERLDLPRGRVRVSWDLHGWLFAADAAAVFVLRFETADVADTSKIDMERDAGMLALRQSSFNRKHHHHGGWRRRRRELVQQRQRQERVEEGAVQVGVGLVAGGVGGVDVGGVVGRERGDGGRLGHGGGGGDERRRRLLSRRAPLEDEEEKRFRLKFLTFGLTPTLRDLYPNILFSPSLMTPARQQPLTNIFLG
uniref:DUF868 domain-containing protein n=1 Tax=Oryza barthii TaxID=65489 RepID=A0A0D3GDI5_9ORYZ